ncbi:RTT103 [Candida margitis]|uniref:RTT103 n=1 Tax=Candida margitis TaxID=1775924 RepID=UPI002226C946|nr:RTT103 [Candida margitis]KAI5963923.1 RTT103 [Candida margitis]
MSAESFASKLKNINETQDSINYLSGYMLQNEPSSQLFIDVWRSQVLNASPATKLLLLYLCNDVIQKAKRHHKTKYISDFFRPLLEVINPIYHSVDSAIKKKIERLISVWEERLVFDADGIRKLKDRVAQPPSVQKSTTATPIQPAVVSELQLVNDLYKRINDLTDVSQGNLTQLGIQSKTYLNLDADTLPETQVHLNKLKVLEKLSNVAIKNIESIKSTREQIKFNLETMLHSLESGLQTDDSKIAVINDKLKRIDETRRALQGTAESSDDDEELPKYVDEDSDDDEPELKKRRASPTPSGGSTPKKVAFAKDIQVNEYDNKAKEDEDSEGDEKEQPKEDTPSAEVMDILLKLA